MNSLERVRALVFVRRLLHVQLDEAVGVALSEGVQRAELAAVLGMSRASFYRQYGAFVDQKESAS